MLRLMKTCARDVGYAQQLALSALSKWIRRKSMQRATIRQPLKRWQNAWDVPTVQ
jgi:hypothetical protein